MIATKTATLMVAMAVMGIVPVAAHAQTSVDTDEIAQILTALESTNTAGVDEDAANVDSDTNTPTNIAFGTVGAGGTFGASQSNTMSDDDTQTNGQTGTATAASGQTATPTLTANQQPTMTVSDVLGLFPGGG